MNYEKELRLLNDALQDLRLSIDSFRLQVQLASTKAVELNQLIRQINESAGKNQKSNP